jgi:hypothetical protein
LYLDLVLNKISTKLDYIEIAKEDFYKFSKEYIEINNKNSDERKKQ